ncbi:unnamed protein product [Linum trigynum]|uniref:F-box domain-containing protein n=1 Tax=Linum trigynum TaxID=586398 RepID=A0AAV2GGN2_9ROSI
MPPPPPRTMTAINNKLGDDLLVEILIRSFPNPKPACRSKLVCKQWNSLISDPILFNRRFVSHHKSSNEASPPPLIVTPSPPSTTFRHHYPSLSFLPVPDQLGPHFKVWDSFNDLLLCGFWGDGINKVRGLLGRFYFVCNPFTKQWVALPLAPERPSGWWMDTFVAWLACEPVNSTTLDLGGGGDDHGLQSYYYFEYRFRVVCMYLQQQQNRDMRADVFCSESGGWTSKALDRPLGDEIINKPCRGRVFYEFTRIDRVPRYDVNFSFLTLFVVSPFTLDAHRTRTTTDHGSLVFPDPTILRILVSQGVLHVVLLELEPKGCSRNALTVWRLEEGGESWRKLHEVVLLKEAVVSSNYDLERCFRVGLHPQKPEIVYLYFDEVGDRENVSILSYDLTGTGEVEFVDEYRRGWKAFQPKVSCWHTLIPRYEELRGGYDESYNYLLQAKQKEWIQM